MTNKASPDTPKQYRKEQIETRQASGKSQQAFCKTDDLNYPRFVYWLRKFRDQGAVAEVPRLPSGFVPVVVSPTGSHLSVPLPNGIELRGVTAQNLPVVEQRLVYCALCMVGCPVPG